MRCFLKIIGIFILIAIVSVAFFDEELITLNENVNLSGVTQIIRIRDRENDEIQRVYKTIKHRYPDKLIQFVEIDGYNSPVKVMIVMDIAERTVSEVKVLNHNETAGNGDRITYRGFLSQFDKFDTDGAVGVCTTQYCMRNEVKTLTNATVSSMAVVTAVNIGIDNFNSMN